MHLVYMYIYSGDKKSEACTQTGVGHQSVSRDWCTEGFLLWDGWPWTICFGYSQKMCKSSTSDNILLGGVWYSVILEGYDLPSGKCLYT